MSITAERYSPKIIYLLILTSGFATLSWEVIWQIKATLALGASAFGTAITLAVIMSGMSVGGFLMGNFLNQVKRVQAIRIYGTLEIVAGGIGLLLQPAFYLLEQIDTWVYTGMPSIVAVISILGIVVILGIPTLCMGASLPIFAIISERFKLSISQLYSINILGAAIGVLFIALVLIPWLGVTDAIHVIAVINILVGIAAWSLLPREFASIEKPTSKERLPLTYFSKSMFIVFISGFATFALEVAWFRSLASIFPNTTDTFALMLACVLIALGLAANKIQLFKLKYLSLAACLFLAGILILLMTPVIERLDQLFYKPNSFTLPSTDTSQINNWIVHADTFITNGWVTAAYILQMTLRFGLFCLVLVPPILLLGMAFPRIIEDHRHAPAIGRLYAVNTFAAIIGSIATAWVLLPTIGFAKTAWFVGGLVIVAGLSLTRWRIRVLFGIFAIATYGIAIHFETGIGRTRAQGFFATDENNKPAKVLEFFEGRDATTAAVEYQDGSRALLINNTLAAWESGKGYRPSAHYMAWMGHLPMLLHPEPKKALVICLGTGQTANAVRKENPQELDIVDINPNVFKLAHNFQSNEGVLNDTRVKAITMDGRAYLRRTKKIYDVITLEPMPPVAIGVNSLYSKEFYQLARARLGPRGVIAQWLPFHIGAPHYNASIARTFLEVFPNSILWIDQVARTGILLGTKDKTPLLQSSWPGFARTDIKRNLTLQEVQAYIAFDTSELKRYASYGEIISDDNQLLSYGKSLYAIGLLDINFELLQRINSKIARPNLTPNFR